MVAIAPVLLKLAAIVILAARVSLRHSHKDIDHHLHKELYY